MFILISNILSFNKFLNGMLCFVRNYYVMNTNCFFNWVLFSIHVVEEKCLQAMVLTNISPFPLYLVDLPDKGNNNIQATKYQLCCWGSHSGRNYF